MVGTVRAGPEQAYPAGVELADQDEPCTDVYYLNEGVVKLTRIEMDGREIIVALRFAGCYLNAPWALTCGRHPVTAITLTKCRIRRIPSETFREAVRTNLQLSWSLHEFHSRAMTDFIERLGQIGCATARHRVEYVLKQFTQGAHMQGRQAARLKLPLKRSELAKLIAVTPEHLSRLLKRMHDEGLVRLVKGWILVPDVRKLAADVEVDDMTVLAPAVAQQEGSVSG